MKPEDIQTIIRALTPEYHVHKRFNGQDVYLFSQKGTIPRVGEGIWVKGAWCTVKDVSHRDHPGYPDHSMINVHV